MTAHATIHRGDALEVLRQMESESVQTVVTSPPYWGLRDYGAAGQLGLERTPAEYISKMVEVFREVRRVLRSNGTCWVNMGDSYASAWVCDRRNVIGNGSMEHGKREDRPNRLVGGLKEKDLVGMPWHLAFALQADGWYLRSDIIWHKPNPMPESVTDRPTKSHEYIFLLTKSERYFYDAEAIKEESIQAGRIDVFTRPSRDARAMGRPKSGNEEIPNLVETASMRNKRTVWTVATQPFPEAHFATFPEELITPCILAGTSEKGCCAECRAPYKRVLEEYDTGARQKMADGWDTGEGGHGTIHRNGREPGEAGVPVMGARTVGWLPSCDCQKTNPCVPFKPCVVLDPFAGSGTVGVVALRYHRNFVGIELNPEYAEMAERRILGDRPLFNRLQSAEAAPEISATVSVDPAEKGCLQKTGDRSA